MSFVERFGLPEPIEPPEHHPAPVPPEWFGPSEEELGAAVNLGAFVGRSDRGVVALSHATVFSTGLRLHVVARARGLERGAGSALMHQQDLIEPGPDTRVPSGSSTPSRRKESGGSPLSTVEIDGAELVAAAERVVALWP